MLEHVCTYSFGLHMIESSDDIRLAPPASPVLVLLIDDQACVGEVIRRALSSEADIELHVCTDPRRALNTAMQLQPSVILQDLVMPGIDGLDLVRVWRTTPATSKIPVIVLSTEEESTVKHAAFLAGANDYLVKLPDAIELIARIRYHSSAYQAMRHRDEALDFLSHDMRLPQVSILALVDNHRDEFGHASVVFERIEMHARRTLALADGFIRLTLAQSETKALEMTDLSEIVVDAVDQLWEKARRLGSRIVMDVPATQCLYLADRMMLTRAISNLIDNALKYGPARSEVRCRLVSDANEWVISVEDAGTGISSSGTQQAVEPFVRIQPGANSADDGFGLGLAFVKMTALKHRGDLSMQHAPVGFVVAIKLPRQ